tara:strand:+ start:75 stop:890 length:816 start_codon:yes stop_codon:yes gene_type:complete
MSSFNLHLISDATGETLQMIANAVKNQFSAHQPCEHVWPMIRTEEQMQEVIKNIQKNPGVVLFTLVNKHLQRNLTISCGALNTPCVDVLLPTMSALQHYLDTESQDEPGIQHKLDKEYFQRINAMQFCLSHDDGQQAENLDKADVILVGVSRTSKTPTCMYLANRGIKAANVPFVKGINPPTQLLELKHPVIIGLTNSVQRLVQLRLNRLNLLKEKRDNTYANETSIKSEVDEARRFFSKNLWPVIDVTGRSIEETAAKIIQMLSKKRSLE